MLSENLGKQISVDTQCFGKFCLVDDPEADSDALYPQKILFEPTGALSALQSMDKTSEIEGKSLLVRNMDFGRLARIARIHNAGTVKRNLEQLATHLVSAMKGQVVDVDSFKGKVLRVNLKIG